MVDDPSYKRVLRGAARLLSLPAEFYCLPEQLLACNLLVDILIVRVEKTFQRIDEWLGATFPELPLQQFHRIVGLAEIVEQQVRQSGD